MKTIVYLMRHGKTQNPKRIVKGILDFKLNKYGQQEVAKIGNYLANKPIEIIYHSPVLRAKQSAKIIQSYLPKAKLKQDNRLIEWWNDWQGKQISQIKDDPSMHWDLYKKDPLHFPVKKGLTARQVVKQMNSFIKEIVKKHHDQQIAAVSHGDPIKLLRCYLETGKISKHFHKYKVTQPSITAFIFNSGKFKKVVYKSFIKNQSHLLE